MPIQLKRSLTSGSLPTTASLVPGELALNVPDGRIFLRKSGSTDTIQSAITTGAQNTGSIALTGSLSIYSPTGSVLDISGDVVTIDGDVIEIAADTMEFTGSFVNSGSLRVIGNSVMSGSLSVSGSVNVFNNEFVVQPTGVNLGNIITDRHTVIGSLNVSGSTLITGSLTVITSSTLSGEVARFQRNVSSILSYSNIVIGTPTYNAYFGVMLNTFDVAYMSSVADPTIGSGIYIRTNGFVGLGWISPTVRLDVSGSSRFGVSQADTHVVTGSLRISGSSAVTGSTSFSGSIFMSGVTNQVGIVTVTGSINASQGFTGSLFGTASWATNAILFPFTGSARITGSLSLSGSFGVLGSQALFVAQDITPTGSISSSYFQISGSVKQPPIVGSRGMFVDISPVMVYTTASQVSTAFRINATFSGSSAFTSSQNNVIADFGSTSAGSQLTITDVTSGSIYMVNDVSGLPIIEANSNWDVFMYDYPNTVFKKTGSVIELGTTNTTASAILFKSDLVINEGYGITHRTQQVSASTAGNVTSSLYTLSFTNTSSSVFLSAIVTGYDTGSRDTISGEIKGTLRYRAGVATLVGTNYSFINSDNSVVNFELYAGGTSGSLLVYGTGSRSYLWGATVTTQII